MKSPVPVLSWEKTGRKVVRTADKSILETPSWLGHPTSITALPGLSFFDIGTLRTLLMFHLAAYTELIDSTTDFDVDALSDDILTIQNSHFVLGQAMDLAMSWVGSTTLTRCKLASPSMRQIASPHIRAINQAILPVNDPNCWLLFDSPFRIKPFEEIQMQATSGVAMGTERFTGLVWLRNGFFPWPQGDIIPLRWTSSGTATANAWSSITLTFADTIPSGQYTMVMSECFSTNAIAHRWIVSNQIMRPGHLSFASNTSRQTNPVARGALGVMGSFRSNDMPRLQVLCNAANNSHEGYLWVVRSGNIS